MKIARRIFLVIGILLVLAYVRSEWRSYQAQKPVQEALAALKRDGFKTEFSELSSGNVKDILKSLQPLINTSIKIKALNYEGYARFASPFGSNSAFVALRDLTSDGQDRWQFLRDYFDKHLQELDTSQFTLLSVPLDVRLNVDKPFAVSPHLNSLSSLSRVLAVRTMLELHYGNHESAWSNLLAITYLATRSKTGPDEIAYIAKFKWLTTAYKTTWETLQTNVWSDEQLALLQAEWDRLKIWDGLPETAAHARVSCLHLIEAGIKTPLSTQIGSPLQMFKDAWNSSLQPSVSYFWEWFKALADEVRYRRHAAYEDQLAAIHYFRDLEDDLKRAIVCKSWSEMTQIPGITNTPQFSASANSRLKTLIRSRSVVQRYQTGPQGLAGSAANFETLRRLIIIALALERYHRKQGDYPLSLSVLAPQFLSEVPLDFMDGQPLRYQRFTSHDFLLYSTGLDCVDNGGTTTNEWHYHMSTEPPFPHLPINTGYDAVWPRAASTVEVSQAKQKLEDYRIMFTEDKNMPGMSPELMLRYGLMPAPSDKNKANSTNQTATTQKKAKLAEPVPR